MTAGAPLRKKESDSMTKAKKRFIIIGLLGLTLAVCAAVLWLWLGGDKKIEPFIRPKAEAEGIVTEINGEVFGMKIVTVSGDLEGFKAGDVVTVHTEGRASEPGEGFYNCITNTGNVAPGDRVSVTYYDGGYDLAGREITSGDIAWAEEDYMRKVSEVLSEAG